jgi:hypothetical protein
MSKLKALYRRSSIELSFEFNPGIWQFSYGCSKYEDDCLLTYLRLGLVRLFVHLDWDDKA